PLTNVAVALTRDPSLAAMVNECVVMGGIGLGHGNVVPAAEYNIWVDPDAAKIVFESGLPITMVGWDISQRYAAFDETQAEELKSLSPLGEFCVDIQEGLRRFGIEKLDLGGFDLPDPIAMAVAIDPTVATVTKHLHVAIETKSELTRGATVVDHLGITGQEPNARVVLAASRERFLHILYDAVQR
ncbi:nucleoside hydrolase, partial [Candidatus Bipolaricaulota bacterium]|nr:nucleoside hydrolase [Candidatus Bipolaricaulota bacterium]